MDPSTEDTIGWKWTADGVYTTHSAYRAQFFGVVKWDHIKLIWRAHTENRCKLFAWILIQNKQLTADNLTVRSWPHLTSCPLCNGPPETGHHLCLLCPFAQMVWLQVSTWENLVISQQALPTDFDNIKDWWEAAAHSFHQSQRRKFNGMAIYIMWNLWKERNRRVFQNEYCTVLQVTELAKEC